MNLLTRIRKIVAPNSLDDQFDSTLSVKIKVNDRVRHRRTGNLGTVYGTGTVVGSSTVPALCVRFDDGSPDAEFLAAEEFTKATRYR